jgi:hypothetical protein
MKWHVVKLASRQNNQLKNSQLMKTQASLKCKFDKMTSDENGKLWQLHIVEMTFDQMTSWQNCKLANEKYRRWYFDEKLKHKN